MYKKFIKVIVSIIVFTVLFSSVQSILAVAKDRRTEYRLEGFYQLEEDTLDAVFIGSSATYAYWIPAYAWEEFGIAVYPYASQGQSVVLKKYLIEEVLKTQPNAKIIVNLSTIDSDMPVEHLHLLTDNMPNSLTKYKMIYDVYQKHDYTVSEMLECVFPIIRYHDRWPETIEREREYVDVLEYMSSPTYNVFLKRAKKKAMPIDYTQYYEELPQYLEDALNELVDYCEENEIDVTYVIVPQASKEKIQMALQNSAIDLLNERGYEVLDMRACAEEVGIVYSEDYYNNKHTNMHGAIKVTNYLSNFIIDKYGFENKHGDETYAQWDEAWDNYYNDYFGKYLKESDLKYFSNPLD